MKNSFSVFYSWQSDIKKNRSLIQSCIEKAIKKVKSDQGKAIGLDINLDRDTRNTSGSPAISKTIFDKISKSDIFICDVTIVNKISDDKFDSIRITPNPNVLIELGYAINVLGWDRIICIINEEYCKVEELPFDIRGHRVTTFSTLNNNCKDLLTNTLIDALKSIIVNYDKILSRITKDKVRTHDLNIFDKLNEACDEVTLKDSLTLATDALYINGFYLNAWRRLQDFYEQDINKFIDTELDELMQVFMGELKSFKNITMSNFHLRDDDPTYLGYLFKLGRNIKLTQEEEYDYLQSQRFFIQSTLPYEDPEQTSRRKIRIQNDLSKQEDKVLASYSNLIKLLKVKSL